MSIKTHDFFSAVQHGLFQKANRYVEVESGLYMLKGDRKDFYVRASAVDMEDAVQRYGLRESSR